MANMAEINFIANTSETVAGKLKMDFNRAAGGTIQAKAIFSETVFVSGVPVMNLTNDNAGPGDGRVQHLEYLAGSGTNTITFAKTLGADDTQSPQNGDTLTIGENSIDLNGGAITDAAGNDVNKGNTASMGSKHGTLLCYTPA